MLGQTSKLEPKKEGRKNMEEKQFLLYHGEKFYAPLAKNSRPAFRFHHTCHSSRSFWKFSFTLSENPLPRCWALSDTLVFKPAAFSLTLTMPLYVSTTRILILYIYIWKIKLEEWKSLAQVFMAVAENHEGPGVGWPGRLIRKITAPGAPEIWCEFLRWH